MSVFATCTTPLPRPATRGSILAWAAEWGSGAAPARRRRRQEA